MIEKIFNDLIRFGESEFSYNSESYVIQKCRNFLLLWACSDTPMTIFEYEIKEELTLNDVKMFCSFKLFEDKSILDIIMA